MNESTPSKESDFYSSTTMIFWGVFLGPYLSFALISINYLRMQDKKKFWGYVLSGIFLIFIYNWLKDTEGQRTLPENYHIAVFFFWLVAYLILLIVLSIRADKDVKSHVNSQKIALPERKWMWLWVSILILLSGNLLRVVINFGAQQFGLCKFPPAYYLFSPDLTPKDDVAIGLISPSDFGCNFFGNSLEEEFNDPLIYSFPIPFEEATSKRLPGDYLDETNLIIIDHYIWVTKNEITNTDIQEAMRFGSKVERSTPITGIELKEIPNAKFQSVYCYNSIIFINCEFSIGFTYVLTKFRVGIYDDVGIEVLEEIVNTAALKTGERLLLIDSTLP